MSIVERVLEKAALGRAAASETTTAARAPRRIVTKGTPLDAELPSDNSKFVALQPEALRAVGLAAPADMELRLAEELRLVKRPLLQNAESDEAHLPAANLMMVASALPGAGKTFLSLNLAISMASELDWTVLLIDADVVRPTLSRKLGLGDVPGLANLLEEERGDFVDYVYKTSVPGLHLLPAGTARSNVKELLSSQRMLSLVAALQEHHSRRVVMFDSPPLLLTSEARVLASYVGQVVVVVESGVTLRRSLLDAIETLDPTKAINLVLNKSWQPLGLGDHQYAYGDYTPFDRRGDDKTEG